MSTAKTPKKTGDDEGTPAMPFDEALKRVWSAKPMPHKVKPKPPEKTPAKKPGG